MANRKTILAQLQFNHDLFKAAHHCADSCRQWAIEYQDAEQFWREEARHAAKSMHALVIQLQRGRDNA